MTARPPICKDHNTPMQPVVVQGAPLHGQRWWICPMQYVVGVIARATCGNTAVTT